MVARKQAGIALGEGMTEEKMPNHEVEEVTAHLCLRMEPDMVGEEKRERPANWQDVLSQKVYFVGS